MNITLKDGSVLAMEGGATPLDVAEKLSSKLKKAALAAKVNGELWDLTRELPGDCTLEILTFADEGGRWTLRHTASHVLAQAVKALYPDAKLAIGPAIDNGFYYDFDVEVPFTAADLLKIEKEMKKLIQQNESLERFELPRAEAIAFMKEKGEDYKVELIEDLPEDAVCLLYTSQRLLKVALYTKITERI